MKNTSNNSKRLVPGKAYYCSWAGRSAKYIGTRKDDSGVAMAYFKDICDCVIKMQAAVVKDYIDWEKTKSNIQTL